MYLTHITTEGERWDQLATRYYGDPLQYERIVAANPHVPLATTLPITPWPSSYTPRAISASLNPQLW